jgi:hypothetical protein
MTESTRAVPVLRKAVFCGVTHERSNICLLLDPLCEGDIRHEAIPIGGKPLRISRMKARRCVGRYDLDSFETFRCPRGAPVDERFTVCRECEAFNAFKPAFYNYPVSLLSERQRRYNAHPHVVYLAHFGCGKIKGGISNERRLITRLTEQGARLAMVLASFQNAYEARELEKRVCALPMISEVVTTKSKRRLLAQHFDPLQAEAELIQMGRQLGDLLGTGLPAQGGVLQLEPYYRVTGTDLLPARDVSESKPLAIEGIPQRIIGQNLIMMGPQEEVISVGLDKFRSHLVVLGLG